MKSLTNFPKAASSKFNPDLYGIDVRQQVGATSPYEGEVGLELELEGTNLPDHYAGRAVNGVTWNWHADGSLRAVGGRAPGGAEYVLTQPCQRADVQPLLANLFDALRASRATIQNSTRCSTHVHLNMRGAKLNQVTSFVTLWATFEDALANWCGAHRSGNHFALRMSDCHGAVDAWTNAFRTGAFNFSRERRYLALNPACLQTFGSLEVRTMAGVDGPDDVVRWVSWLLKIKDAAFGAEFENPLALAAAFSGDGVRGFSERILGPECVAELREACNAVDEDFERLVVDGFRRIQPLVYSLPWEDVLPAIKRAYVPDPFGRRPARPVRDAARPRAFGEIAMPEPEFD